MNITRPLPPTQFELKVDTPSLVREVASNQPRWIHDLIVQTLSTNLVPLTYRQLREVIVLLCPADVPEHTPEVEWASRKIMQERLGAFTRDPKLFTKTRQRDTRTLRALGFTSQSAIKRSGRLRQRKLRGLIKRARDLLSGRATFF